MTEAQQKESLLNLVEVLLLRLGAYYTFSEVVRIMVGDEFVDESVAEALREPALRDHVKSIAKGFAASLPESKHIDPDQVLRDALATWSARGKPQ